MTLKHVLKHFNKTELQDDERFSLAPMREREELLCERSELSNSGEGCKDLPSPDRHPLPRKWNKVSCAEHTVTDFSPFTTHFSQLCTPHPSPLPQGAREQLLCAEHTVTNLFSYSPIYLFTFKKVAFTLAEVLITLAIIGVVAAVTMSTIKHIRYAGYAQTFLKTYSEIQQAHNNVVSKYGDPSTWPFAVHGVSTDNSGNEQIASWYMDEFKIAKICTISGWLDSECKPGAVGTKTKWLSGNLADYRFVDYVDASSYAALLPDGRLIQIGFGMTHSGTLWCYPKIFFTVDVNGRFKKPNQLGRDIFLIAMDKNSSGQYAIQPMRSGCSWFDQFGDTCKPDSTGFSCSENIIIDHAMKY